MISYALALAHYAQRRKTAAKVLQIFQIHKFFRKKKPLCLNKWRFCEEKPYLYSSPNGFSMFSFCVVQKTNAQKKNIINIFAFGGK